MSSEPTFDRPELSRWRVESLRLTAFPALVASFQQGVVQPGWEAAVGSQPQNRLSMAHGQEVAEDGPFVGGRLFFHRQQVRLDWILQAEVLPMPAQSPLIGFGMFVEALPSFEQVMLQWLPHAPPLNRLAFGAVLTLEVTDWDVGYRLLSTMLPFRLDPANSRDFLYQINRPRRSSTTGAEGLSVNRLSKWSVNGLVSALLQIPGGIGWRGQPVYNQPQQCFCRLELDINTPAERVEPLPQTILGGLLRELVAAAREIGEEGDLP